MYYKDKTFCRSLGCKNKCGRQMTDQEFAEVTLGDEHYITGDFCDSQGNLRKEKE